MNELIIFGGTFNPVHKGHLHIIHLALSKFKESKILIVPAYISPFKANENVLSFEHRYKMLELSLEYYKETYPLSEYQRIELSDIEYRMRKKVYTSELVKTIKDNNKNLEKIFYLAGDDILKDLDKWNNTAYLKKYVSFLIFSRIRNHDDCKKRIEEGFDIKSFDSEIMDASSKKIRENNVFEMLPETVASYYSKII